SIDMLVFSRKDIEKYFNEMGLVTVDAQVTDFVQAYSRGVPYAVDLLTNAMERMGTVRFVKDFDAEEFREQLKNASSDEDVIRCISRRFLKYCLDEPGEKQDRDRIFTVAALQDMDSAVLKAVWGVEKPFDLLQELQAKYALFIRDNKLHDVVKDFLVEYLIENKNLRDELIGPAMEKALPIYRRKYEVECEKEPVWEDRAREPRWKEALLKLMNALAWFSLDEAVEFFIQRGIELFLIGPSLVRELKSSLVKFLETGNEVRGRDRKKILALMDALKVFEWNIESDKNRKELPRVLSFCNEALDEWKPGPVHAAVLQLIKGRTEYHQKNYDSAFITLLERVDDTILDKSLKNKLAEAHNDLGIKLSVNENNRFFFSEKALKAFNRAVQLNDKKSTYFYDLGVMLSLEKNYTKAIEMYQKAINLDPKDAYSYYGAGNIYKDLKNYEETVEMYQKAIELDPKFAYPYNGLGNVYSDLRDYDKAIEMYRKAIELDPKYAYPYNGVGIVYRILKKYDKAIEMYQKAIELDPKYAYPYNG
ncbi:MAG TPA: tetratricopeptide repeat protein, partial [Candidatus Kapabacteria bacterium]|nr:tetratricopeptide repeat protein [Candidatus Kapabacteria bacterium]